MGAMKRMRKLIATVLSTQKDLTLHPYDKISKFLAQGIFFDKTK